MTKHLLIADVLGFSNLVSNLSHSDLEKRLEAWVTLVPKILGEKNGTYIE